MSVPDEFDEPQILEDFVPYLAHRIGSLMDQNIAPYLKDSDLSMEMWRVLFVLSQLLLQ